MKNRQEILIDVVDKHFTRYFQEKKFKGVPMRSLQKILVYWYLSSNENVINEYRNNIMNDLEFEELLKELINKYLLQTRLNTFSDFLYQVRKDLKLWIQDFFKYEPKIEKVDFIFHIDSVKYYSHVLPLAKKLNDEGKKVTFLLYSSKEIQRFTEFNYVLLFDTKNRFPLFWKKSYIFINKQHSIVRKLFYVYRKSGFPITILVEGDSFSHHSVGYIAKEYGFKTYCLQWGYVGTSVVKLGWRNMPFSAFLSWGKFFEKSLIPNNANLKMIDIGHPNIKYNSNVRNEKNKILFAISKVMPPFINYNDLVKFIETAITLSNSQNKYKVILRTHPNFTINNEINNLIQPSKIEVHNYFSHDYKESFKDVKYVISISSTISIESIGYGCLPVFLRVNNIPLLVHQELKPFLNYAFVINEPSKITEEIVELDIQTQNVKIDSKLFYPDYQIDEVVKIFQK